MNTHDRPSLRFLSLNVNGLRDRAKRHQLFDSLLLGNWDVIVLQETHHGGVGEGESWAKEGAGVGRPWVGLSFWCSLSTSRCGVAVLFKSKDKVEDTSIRFQDPGGRVLVVDFDFESHNFSVVSVYAPCERGDRLAFFNNILLPCLPADRRLLLGGDFNCIASDEDQVGGEPGSRLHGYSGGLEDVEAERHLYDAWRGLHPDSHSITHTATTRQSAARLDRWLVSTSMQEWVDGADIVIGLPGDHCGVSLFLVIKTGVLRGPGAWSFPLSLLDDSEFKTFFQSSIESYLESHPCTPQYTLSQQWEGLKVYIRDISQQFFFAVQKRRRLQESRLQSQAKRAKAAFEEQPTLQRAQVAWLQAQTGLQEFYRDRSRVAALRAGVVWQDYGEQSTFWFYHLAGQRSRDRLISELQTSPDEPPLSLSLDSSIEPAAALLSDHFSSDSASGLFREHPVERGAQDALLASVDRIISPEHRGLCEGDGMQPLSEEELLAALNLCHVVNAQAVMGFRMNYILHFGKFWGLCCVQYFQMYFPIKQHQASPPHNGQA